MTLRKMVITADEHDKREPKVTPFEVLTKLIVPALSVLASIVALVQDQRLLAWALVGLFVLSLVVGFYPVAASWAGACMQRRGDEIIARREFPELRKLVEQFGEFIDRGRGDNLHYVVQSDVYGGYSDRFNTLGLPNINLFQSLWCNLTERAANQKPTPTDLKTTSSELSTLVSLYNNYCMNQVFEQLPQELRTQLSDRSKSNLEACRERFVAFLNDYSKYLKHFDEPFAARYLQTRDFPRPRPL